MLTKVAKKLNDIDPGFLPAVAGELFLTFLFVFTTVGAAIATDKMSDGKASVPGLMVSAMANMLAVAAIVSAGVRISGAHLNPVVSLVMALGGRISVHRFVLYFVVQLGASALACLVLRFVSGGMLVASSLACLVLRLLSGGMLLDSSLVCLVFWFLSGGVEIPVHALGSGVGSFQGLGMEMILTFSLLFTVYSTMVDPGTDVGPGLAPLIVGLLVGGNTLVGGLFTGASMNPARSFGPALVSWTWTNHWVYWAGPIFGGVLAGFIYERFLIVRPSYAALSGGVEDV